MKPQPLPDSDESYKLTVDANGVNISANTRFGALRAMETLLQLMQNGAENTSIPWVTIEDSPRFPWRGLLLDSARHFLPIPDIKRQIDGMAAAKLNVLHWHLTDDQGWRFTSKRYPKLTQLASDGLFYTPEQMREIVRYAAERGIRVVPEIDMPGHASAIAVAYPELMSAPGPYAMERHWGVLKPVLDQPKRQLIPLPTRWSANWRRSSRIRICILAAMRLTTASGKRTLRSRRLCATTNWRTATRCRRISTASWRRSLRSTTGRWLAGMRSTIPICRKAF